METLWRHDYFWRCVLLYEAAPPLESFGAFVYGYSARLVRARDLDSLRRLRAVSAATLAGVTAALTRPPRPIARPNGDAVEPLSNPGWGIRAIRKSLEPQLASYGDRGGILSCGQLLYTRALSEVYASQWPLPRRGGVDQWHSLMADLLSRDGARRVAILAMMLLSYRERVVRKRYVSKG